MIAYVWVALGGAIGSVCRFGFGVAAARLWGESFPWGTIAINIIGSFVIGFFGTLTAPGGLLPGGPNLRIFVMVGICGGFTTFSSFSLQTLSLAREGSWFGAAGNVALSVTLCITAVTIGHLSGERIGLLRGQAPAGPPHVLAVLDRIETARPVLAAAALAADRVGKARIEVLHVRHTATQGFMLTEEVMTEARLQEVSGAAALQSRVLHDAFLTWRAESGAGTWREEAGDAERTVTAEAKAADIVVMARLPASEAAPARRALNAVLFDARQPLLLVSETVPSTLGMHIAVAWKPGKAAGRALAAALPLLRRAERITVLMAGEDGNTPPALPPLLARERIVAHAHRFDVAGRGIGAALLAEANRCGADLLVMGAYTRNRLSEAAFGGATRTVLAQADLPVLLRH